MKEALEGFLKGGDKGSEIGTGAPPPSFDLGDDSEDSEEGGANPLLTSIQGKLASASDAQLAEIDKILSGGGKGGDMGMPPMPPMGKGPM
jgi:hypothetical protein